MILWSDVGAGGVWGSLPGTVWHFLRMDPHEAQKAPECTLLLESMERADGWGKWVGEGLGAKAVSASTSVCPLLPGKSGHLLPHVPVPLWGCTSSVQ